MEIPVNIGDRTVNAKVQNPLMQVKICTKCGDFAFSAQNYSQKKVVTVCPCGTNMPTMDKKIPMTADNFKKLRAVYDKIFK